MDWETLKKVEAMSRPELVELVRQLTDELAVARRFVADREQARDAAIARAEAAEQRLYDQHVRHMMAGKKRTKTQDPITDGRRAYDAYQRLHSWRQAAAAVGLSTTYTRRLAREYEAHLEYKKTEEEKK